MSINLENPETVMGKVDAALTFIAQIRIALMIGDMKQVDRALEEANRHLVNAMAQLEEAQP